MLFLFADEYNSMYRHVLRIFDLTIYFVYGWQPEEVGITSHKSENGLQNSELNNSKVSQEMFDSIVREVVEEIGVPAAALVRIFPSLLSYIN